MSESAGEGGMTAYIFFLQPERAEASPPELASKRYPPTALSSFVIVTGSRFATTMSFEVILSRFGAAKECSDELDRVRSISTFPRRSSRIDVGARRRRTTFEFRSSQKTWWEIERKLQLSPSYAKASETGRQDWRADANGG